MVLAGNRVQASLPGGTRGLKYIADITVGLAGDQWIAQRVRQFREIPCCISGVGTTLEMVVDCRLLNRS